MNIVIFGSTGSIGKQTLDVIKQTPKKFKTFGLASYQNIDTLYNQIVEFQPKHVAVFLKDKANLLSKKIRKLPEKIRPKIFTGIEGWKKLATFKNAGKLVFASSGITALPALISAIEAKKNIAIANKEMIVAEGKKIMNLAKKNNVILLPIDSEHSAIFQLLRGEHFDSIAKVILTCSGGPFYGKTRKELQNVTAEKALRHPVWSMGNKISIDSATLINKGLEVIEAQYLFGLKEKQIEIVIHPQSVVHGFIVFKDGTIKAVLNRPDMRIHIGYALSYPKRFSMKNVTDAEISFDELSNLTFIKPDFSVLKGPLLTKLAFQKGRQALKKMLIINDEAVRLFLDNKIGFLDIYRKIEEGLKNF